MLVFHISLHHKNPPENDVLTAVSQEPPMEVQSTLNGKLIIREY